MVTLQKTHSAPATADNSELAGIVSENEDLQKRAAAALKGPQDCDPEELFQKTLAIKELTGKNNELEARLKTEVDNLRKLTEGNADVKAYADCSDELTFVKRELEEEKSSRKRLIMAEREQCEQAVHALSQARVGFNDCSLNGV